MNVRAVAFILSAAIGWPATALAQDVTYARDIAPLIDAKCGACHHEGGVAPFGLLAYEDVRQRATLVADATARRYMPPWMAEPQHGPYVGQDPLTPAEIDLIQRWVSGGALEGDPAARPPVPRFTGGWQLGTPDLVVQLSQAYELQADGTDVFRIFVIPLTVNEPRFVRGLEFHPGNAAVVHHANIRIDRTDASLRYDEEDPALGYDGLIAHSATYPDGHFLGWTPGQVAPLLPPGLAWGLEPGSDLVVEVHMQPSGRPERVQPSIGLYFTDQAPSRTPVMLRLGRQGIDIAPGDPRYIVEDSFVLPVDVRVQAVQPHAHYRAREMMGVAQLPDGRVRPLIHIRDWDFRWQHVFRYETPFVLPKGTTLAMRYVYDNSAENPRNPVQPPRQVFWGQRSQDEMGDLWIQVLPMTDADSVTLQEAFAPKVLAEDLLGYQRELDRDPNSVALHNDLAMLNLRLGRNEQAVDHFGSAVRLDPRSPVGHFNLGTALTLVGRLSEAIGQFELALKLRPGYAQAHNNLGRILLGVGKTAAAMPHLQEAVRLDPSSAEARFSLAEAYAASGDRNRARALAQEALKLSPSDVLARAIREALERYGR